MSYKKKNISPAQYIMNIRVARDEYDQFVKVFREEKARRKEAGKPTYFVTTVWRDFMKEYIERYGDKQNGKETQGSVQES